MLRGCICGVSDALMNGAPVQCNIAGWEGAGWEGGLEIWPTWERVRTEDSSTRTAHAGPAPARARRRYTPGQRPARIVPNLKAADGKCVFVGGWDRDVRL